MEKTWFGLLSVAAVAMLPLACSHVPSSAVRSGLTAGKDAGIPRNATERRAFHAIQDVRNKYAPDIHLAIFDIGAFSQGRDLVVTGEVSEAAAKLATVRAIESAGIKVIDRINVLPSEDLRAEAWGISCLSVASGREKPDHKAEMGTQVLMGHSFRIWKGTMHWSLVQTADGYLAWLESGSFVRCAREQVEGWSSSPLLIVTAFEDRVVEEPRTDAEEISDVVMGDLVSKTGDEGEWFKIKLPDERRGYLPKRSAQEYGAWKQSRHATPDSIEQTGRMFLGRPYLWGGNSPKGLDCSGFTKLVFALNGVALNRNASQQALQGVEVPVDTNLSELKKGDLLCFESRSRWDGSERISHVGIYLGEKRFIQSSQRVRISSLDPNSPLYDERHGRMRLYARRILKE